MGSKVPEIPKSFGDPMPIVDDGPLKKFADSSIQKSMETILARLPEGHTAAFIGVATQDGAKAMAVVKLKHGWSVMGALEKEWSGDLKGEVAVGWSG